MLASRAAHNARASFLSLPPHLRLLSHQQSSRSFSASPSSKIELSDLVAGPPLAILQGLHAAGIPWYAAIPAAAVLVRGIFGYYFAAAPNRRRQQIRNNLHPLLAAHVRLAAQKNPKDAKTGLELIASNPKSRRTLLPFLSSFQFYRTNGPRFGAPLIAMSSILNPILLMATSEAVRMLCGARQGILSAILTPFTMLGRFLAPEHFPPGANPVDVIADAWVKKVEQQMHLKSLQENGANNGMDLEALSGNVPPTAEPLPSQLVNTSAPYFDPSLQTEGLSWCIDLTATDSTLPMLTGAAMLGSILLNPQPVSDPSSLPSWTPLPMKNAIRSYSTLQYIGMAMSCVWSSVLQNVPAAVVLYFFSSYVTGFVQKKWLDYSMPLRSAIQPCVRRTRVRSKKQFSFRQ